MDDITFTSRLHVIHSHWDARSGSLSKDLKVLNRPRTFFQRIFAILFRPSESKSLKLALDRIKVFTCNNPKFIQNDISRQRILKIVETAESKKVSKKWEAAIKINCTDLRSMLEKNDPKGPGVSEDEFSVDKEDSWGELSVDDVNSEDELSVEEDSDLELPSDEILGASCFEEAKARLAELKENITVDSSREDVNQALILARHIKHRFIPKNVKLTDEQRELKRIYLDCQESVLTMIFADRLKKGREYTERLRSLEVLQGDALAYLDHLDRKLAKGKPVVSQDSHKWHHCTYRADSILQSKKILYKHEGLYPGAYASTHPEWIYGEGCFVFNGRIENQIKSSRTRPLITNCEIGDYALYIGRRKRGFPSPHNLIYEIPRPRVWAGFQKAINFSMPNKKTDPLGYYSDKKLDLFAGNKYSLSSDSQRFLDRHRVFVMSQDDYAQFHKAVAQNFHLHLDRRWRDAPHKKITEKLGDQPGVMVIE
ncbi:MAG: hypothetical protein ACSNEK_06600 [Parachlamydiaceae bacterium]